MKSKPLAVAAAAVLLAFLSLSCASWPSLWAGEKGPEEKAARPAHWAVPIEKPGLPNFYRVTDDLYRGAQPTAEGVRELKKMGIKTIVNLRWLHSDRDEIGETDIACEHICTLAWDLEADDAVQFLKIATDKAKTPVFVHCQHGADRTGTMCAVYRIAVCGWTKDEAIKEMTQGGFGYHKLWSNLIRLIRRLDIEDVKRRAGLGAAATPPRKSESGATRNP